MSSINFAGSMTATLHSDRVGNEWIVITSDDYPDYEGEITMHDDPPLFIYFREMFNAG